MMNLQNSGHILKKTTILKWTKFAVYYYLGNFVQHPLQMVLTNRLSCRNSNEFIVSLRFFHFEWLIDVVIVLVDVIVDVLSLVFVQLLARLPALLNYLVIRIWHIVVTSVLVFYTKLSLLNKFLLAFRLVLNISKRIIYSYMSIVWKN